VTRVGTALSGAELREVQLGVLREVNRFCRATGLTYYLAYGTLLGAVRHGGYIPWDDDVDVMMPRSDYETFVERFAGAAPDHLGVAGPGTRPGWPLPYVKADDDRTELREPLEEPVRLGVNVDVFPLDVVPASPLLRRVQALELRLLRWALELRYISAERGRGWHGAVAIRLVKPALRRVSLDRLVRAVTRSARRGAGRPSGRVGVRVGSFDWAVPQEWLGAGTEVDFEGLRCRAPAHPAAVLTALYGDWRRLPPTADRTSQHAFTVTWRTPG
jgi:lipopolysaccharide cholinephosphotransferase